MFTFEIVKEYLILKAHPQSLGPTFLLFRTVTFYLGVLLC